MKGYANYYIHHVYAFGALFGESTTTKMKLSLLLSINIVGVVALSCNLLPHDFSEYPISLWKDTSIREFAKALENNDTILANVILEKEGIDIDSREPKYGASLLFWAIEQHNIDIADYLMKKGANPNLHNTWTGNSPIMMASHHSIMHKDKHTLEDCLLHSVE